MEPRQAVAKSKVYKAKLSGINDRLEELEEQDLRTGLIPRERLEYDELIKSYKDTAMAWIKFRKQHKMAFDMICVEWS
jgi:hypothetical protein